MENAPGSRRLVLSAGPLTATEGALAVRWEGGAEALDGALALIREATGRGLSPIGLVAGAPPSPAQLSAVRQAGVTEVVLALHGARAEVHDWHADAGSFDATLRAMSAARALGLAIAVATSVTRSNARVLIEMPALLKPSGVVLWTLHLARASEESTFTRVVPRLGLGVPPALAAIDRARRHGLEARVLGMPVCTLGPFAALTLPSPARAYAEPCDGCAARARCPGVDAAYLARFGSGELRTLEALAPRAPAPAIAALAAALHE